MRLLTAFAFLAALSTVTASDAPKKCKNKTVFVTASAKATQDVFETKTVTNFVTVTAPTPTSSVPYWTTTITQTTTTTAAQNVTSTVSAPVTVSVVSTKTLPDVTQTLTSTSTVTANSTKLFTDYSTSTLVRTVDQSVTTTSTQTSSVVKTSTIVVPTTVVVNATSTARTTQSNLFTQTNFATQTIPTTSTTTTTATVTATTTSVVLGNIGNLLTSTPTNLLENGSFENSAAQYCQDDWCFTTDAAVAPWKSNANKVEVDTQPWANQHGKWSMDLNHDIPYTLTQTVTLVAGKKYTLGFYLNQNALCGSSTKSVKVTSGPTSKTYNHQEGQGWLQLSQTFTASAAKTDISFQSLTEGSCGPVIDNVTLVESA